MKVRGSFAANLKANHPNRLSSLGRGQYLRKYSFAWIASCVVLSSPTGWASSLGKHGECSDLVVTDVGVPSKNLSAPSSSPSTSSVAKGDSHSSEANKSQYPLPSLSSLAFYAHDDHLPRTFLVDKYRMHQVLFDIDFQNFVKNNFHLISATARQKQLEGLTEATKIYQTSLKSHGDLVLRTNKAKKVSPEKIMQIAKAQTQLDQDRQSLQKIYGDAVQLVDGDGTRFKNVSTWIEILKKRLAALARLENEISERAKTQDSPEQLKWKELGLYLINESASILQILKTIQFNLDVLEVSTRSSQDAMKAARNTLELPQYEFIAPPITEQESSKTGLMVKSDRPLVERIGLRPLLEKVGLLKPKPNILRPIEIELYPGLTVGVHQALPEEPRKGDAVFIANTKGVLTTNSLRRDLWNLSIDSLPWLNVYHIQLSKEPPTPWVKGMKVSFKQKGNYGELKAVTYKPESLFFNLEQSSSQLARYRFFTWGSPDSMYPISPGRPGIRLFPMGVSKDGQSFLMSHNRKIHSAWLESNGSTIPFVTVSTDMLRQIVNRAKAIESRATWSLQLARSFFYAASMQTAVAREWTYKELQQPFPVGSLAGRLFKDLNGKRDFRLVRITEQTHHSQDLVWTDPDLIWQGFRIGDVIFKGDQQLNDVIDVSPIYRLVAREYAEVLGFKTNGDIVVFCRNKVEKYYKTEVLTMSPRDLSGFGNLPVTANGRRDLSNTLEAPAYFSHFTSPADVDFQSEREFIRYQRYVEESQTLPKFEIQQLRNLFQGDGFLDRKIKMLSFESNHETLKLKRELDRSLSYEDFQVKVLQDFDSHVVEDLNEENCILEGHTFAAKKNLYWIEDRSFVYHGFRIGDRVLFRNSNELSDVVGFGYNGDVLIRLSKGRYVSKSPQYIANNLLYSSFPEDRRPMHPPEDFVAQ